MAFIVMPVKSEWRIASVRAFSARTLAIRHSLCASQKAARRAELLWRLQVLEKRSEGASQ